MFLHGGNGVQPNSLRRLTLIEIVRKLDASETEMPLSIGPAGPATPPRRATAETRWSRAGPATPTRTAA